MSLDQSQARNWSKERILVEIRERQEEIRELNRQMLEDDAEYASRGYKGVESGWYMGTQSYNSGLEKEIEFLKSLL